MDAKANVVELRGEVVEVRFRKDNGWGVLSVREAGTGEDRIVTGMVSRLCEGQFVEAKGEWVQGRRGKEFKASFIRTDLPASPAGIIKFLSAGSFVGIGPKTAERLVHAFGAETLHVIIDAPERVAQVQGLGLRKAKALQDAMSPMRIEGPVVARLREVMGEGQARRVLQVFGGQAGQIIDEDPYALARKVPGFGFAMADKVAMQTSVKGDDPKRIHAAAEFALLDAEKRGHCCLPLSDLEKVVAKMTKLPPASVERERLDLVLQPKVKAHRLNGAVVMQRAEIEAIEIRVAAEIKRRMQRPVDDAVLSGVDVAIGRSVRARGLKRDWRQEQGVRQALGARISVITGFPGTGKSAALAILVDVIGTDKVTLAAPTGKAARRMREATGIEASTLHTLLGYNPRTNSFTFNADIRLPCRFVVIDEWSMGDLALMDALLQALPDDAQLLLMGDVDQLPSVGAGNVLADLILSGVVPVTRFEVIHRQGAGSAVLHNARLVNRGIAPDFTGMSREFRFIEAGTAEEARDKVLEQIEIVLPRRGYDLRRDVQVLVAMNKGPIGVEELNGAIQRVLPYGGGPEIQRPGFVLRVGDKVIQIKNDYELGTFNGDSGLVEHCDTAKGRVVVRFDGRRVEYGPEKLRFLMLAGAITVHRAQGSEFPVVIMPVAPYNEHMLDRQLIYTTMTRAKQECVLIGPRRLVERAVASTPKGVRHTLLRQRLRGEL